MILIISLWKNPDWLKLPYKRILFIKGEFYYFHDRQRDVMETINEMFLPVTFHLSLSFWHLWLVKHLLCINVRLKAKTSKGHAILQPAGTWKYFMIHIFTAYSYLEIIISANDLEAGKDQFYINMNKTFYLSSQFILTWCSVAHCFMTPYMFYSMHYPWGCHPFINTPICF